MDFDINNFKSVEQCQYFVDANLTEARYERAKAAGYAALATITAVAISAITYYACFAANIAYLAAFSDPYIFYWMDEFAMAHLLFGNPGILNGLVSIFPIKMATEGLLKDAQAHWNHSNELYGKVQIAIQRKIELA